jgi:hypothetical protein
MGRRAREVLHAGTIARLVVHEAPGAEFDAPFRIDLSGGQFRRKHAAGTPTGRTPSKVEPPTLIVQGLVRKANHATRYRFSSCE